MQFRKKPIVVDAIQTKDAIETSIRNTGDLPTWLLTACRSGSVSLQLESATIKTLEGEMLANWDDWIICGVKGEVYPCRDDIFRITYDAIG